MTKDALVTGVSTRTCRRCGAPATHHAVCHIPRQIITAGDRVWDMLEEVSKWYCDECAPEHASPTKLAGTNNEPADADQASTGSTKATRRPPMTVDDTRPVNPPTNRVAT